MKIGIDDNRLAETMAFFKRDMCDVCLISS